MCVVAVLSYLLCMCGVAQQLTCAVLYASPPQSSRLSPACPASARAPPSSVSPGEVTTATGRWSGSGPAWCAVADLSTRPVCRSTALCCVCTASLSLPPTQDGTRGRAWGTKVWDGVPGKREEIRGTLKELWRHHTPPASAGQAATARAGTNDKAGPGRHAAVAGPEL